jgi:hypothetical protein
MQQEQQLAGHLNAANVGSALLRYVQDAFAVGVFCLAIAAADKQHLRS